MSCIKQTNTDNTPATSGGQSIFVSATLTASYTAAELTSLSSDRGFGSYSAFSKYAVDFYKIVYKTNYNGSQIEASGLLAIPKNTSSTPALLCAQHSTIFTDSDAPSNFPKAYTGYEMFAAAGFIAIMPDYIGYGSSSSIVHPFYDEQYSGSAVVDMIKAVKYYLATKSIKISSKLFLLGYSEGGYVTMAAQKQIETAGDNSLTVTAAAEGAGCYDLTTMLSDIRNAGTYDDPSFVALMLNAYNTTYGWGRPLSDFFNAKYASVIPQLINGTKTGTQINGLLTTSVAGLLNTTFYNKIADASAELTLKAKLQANSFPNWYPQSPTRLYHGTADVDVFYNTTQTTYDRFKAAGAPNLKLISIPNGTHESSVTPMMLDAIPWIETFYQL